MRRTQQQTIEAIRERAGKMTVHFIADELGLTVNSTNWYACKNGISLNVLKIRWSRERCAHLLKRLKEGVTLANIAKEFGISQAGITNQMGRLRAAGMEMPAKRNRGAWSRAETNTMLAMVAKGWSNGDIAVVLKRRKQTVANRLSYLRKKGVEVAER